MANVTDVANWENKLRDMEAVDVESLSGDGFENYRKYALTLLTNWKGISPAQDRRLRACTGRVLARMKAEAQFLRVRSKALDVSIRASRYSKRGGPKLKVAHTPTRRDSAMTEDTKKLDKAERDEMRKANPLIDELLDMRYSEADHADYGTLGDAASVRHGDYMDQLQDEISEIVGDENFDAFWDDYEDER